jgi:hypothetical protein
MHPMAIPNWGTSLTVRKTAKESIGMTATQQNGSIRPNAGRRAGELRPSRTIDVLLSLFALPSSFSGRQAMPADMGSHPRWLTPRRRRAGHNRSRCSSP